MIEICFSQLWRLEVQDQGASMVSAEVARELWGISFVEALTPFIRKAPCLNSLPKVPPAHTITWGIRIPTCDSGGDTYSDHSTKSKQENENKYLAM